MIRLIAVLTEGGVPVVIKTYVETEGEMIIGALISAAKTLCDAMGSGARKADTTYLSSTNSTCAILLMSNVL